MPVFSWLGSNPYQRFTGENMKAKEWVATLVPMARDDNRADEYVNTVEALTSECLAIFKLRLKNIDQDWRRTADERMIAAFREAAVKWDAVVHHVQIELGTPAPFPLMRGALLLPHLTSLLEDVNNKRINQQAARGMQRFLKVAADRLGWDRYLFLKALFDMLELRLSIGATAQLQTYIDTLARYRTLRNRKDSGETLTPAECNMLSGLEQWLLNTRRETMSEFNSLSPKQKLAAMYSMGAIFG